MQSFIFENPTKVVFGKGTISRIGSEVRRFGTNVLFVYGRNSIKNNGDYDQVITSLGKVTVTVVEFPGVKSNPVLSHVLKGIELARQEGVDVIVAVGGGSVIDTAKTTATGVMAEPGDEIGGIAENAFALSRVWGLKDYSQGVISEILHMCNG